MTTRYIGITELRRSMPAIARRSKAKKERFILQSKDGICFELRPIVKAVAKKVARPKKRVYKESFIQAMREAEEDVKEGRVSSLEDVMKRLGI